MPEFPIVVLGVSGPELGKDAGRALQDADLVVGGGRHLDGLSPPGARRLALRGDLSPVLDAVAAETGRVCVLASGDPGFFGVVRVLAERFGPERLEIHPAPSAVALAFARLGVPWDDAVVVSAHGRPLEDAARRAAGAAKAAVLTSPDNPPEALGRALIGIDGRHQRVAVCSRLGTDDETVVDIDLPGLAAGEWDPLSIVVLLEGGGVSSVGDAATLAWGLPDDRFAHREGMVTKAEVRAVALGKLALPATGVLWDIGAGSASVAIECVRLAPGLRVWAVERRPDDAARARSNAAAHGVAVEVVEGTAPACLDHLPTPDRVFVGGGGVAMLDAVLQRLGQDGRVVATYAALDRAADAATRLGHLVQVQVSRGRPLPDGTLRLAAENPVFVTWGPAE